MAGIGPDCAQLFPPISADYHSRHSNMSMYCILNTRSAFRDIYIRTVCNLQPLFVIHIFPVELCQNIVLLNLSAKFCSVKTMQ